MQALGFFAGGDHATGCNVVAGGAAALLSTCLMVELNNTNALIRIYSRMVSCCFLIMMTMHTFLYWNMGTALTTLGVTVFLYTIFHSYQHRQAAGWVYYAFCGLSVASIAFIQIAFFLPLLWIMMFSRLLSMSIRTFSASLLGILTPYWLFSVIKVWQGDIDSLANHFRDIATFSQPFDTNMLGIHELVSGAFILLCALIGTIHYIRTRHQDRIKTQMLYEMMITVNYAAIIFLILQPQHYNKLIGIIEICTSTLIAHFIALTHTYWTNLLTKILLVSTIAITIFNLCRPSLNF